MNKDEIARKLVDFADYLNTANIIADPFRWLAWVIVRGIAALVDGLEKITDEVLFIKEFFQNPEIVAFIATIRPVLFIILALNLLFVGYLLIFQKKFDREGIAINLFIALAVVALLGTSMEKANEFTDEAIEAVKTDHLYHTDGNASLSDTIIQRNVTDLVMFDKNGWSSPELNTPNDFPPSKAKNIDIKQRFVKSDLKDIDIDISSTSEDISKHYLVLGEGGADKIAKFDQSGLEWNNEYYYRYNVDWVTLVVTLLVMGFTLFSIAYKLARLAFEMTFNYVLAIIVAPADIHDGQKTKKILQSILNTFLVMILIFLSMKVYMIGTGYLADQLDGLAYLIALIAFSVAVIDGPNIVERLFGIDAGLKSGWGVLAGAYAGTKLATGVGKGLANMMKDDESGSSEGVKLSQNRPKASTKAPSPNDENAKGKNNPITEVAHEKDSKGQNLSSNKATKTPNTDNGEGSANTSDEATAVTGTKGISALLEQQETQKNTRTKAPSPNGAERADLSGSNSSLSSSDSVQKATGIQKSTVHTDTDITSVSEQSQDNPSGHKGGTPSPTTASPTNAQNTSGSVHESNGSNSVQNMKGIQNSTVQTDVEIENVTEQLQGNTTTNTGSTSPSTVNPANTAVNTTTSSNSNSSQKMQHVHESNIQTDTDILNIANQTQGKTTVQNVQTSNTRNEVGSQIQNRDKLDHPSTPIRRRPSSYTIPRSHGIIKDTKF